MCKPWKTAQLLPSPSTSKNLSHATYLQTVFSWCWEAHIAYPMQLLVTPSLFFPEAASEPLLSVVVLGLKSRPGAVAAGWQLYFRPRPGSSADECHTARLGWGVYDFVLYCRTHIISSHLPPSRNCRAPLNKSNYEYQDCSCSAKWSCGHLT